MADFAFHPQNTVVVKKGTTHQGKKYSKDTLVRGVPNESVLQMVAQGTGRHPTKDD